MPVEVVSKTTKRARRAARRNIRRAIADGVEAGVAAARAAVPVSDMPGAHLIETIAGRVSELPGGDPVGEYTAGDPAGDVHHAWFVEAGTGRHHAPGRTEDEPPPGGGRRQWVYFNARLGAFFTTTGNPPRPFMGPSYEIARPVVERAARRIFR